MQRCQNKLNSQNSQKGQNEQKCQNNQKSPTSPKIPKSSKVPKSIFRIPKGQNRRFPVKDCKEAKGTERERA